MERWCKQYLLADLCTDGLTGALVPHSHGKPHVDEKRVLISVIFISRNVLRLMSAGLTKRSIASASAGAKRLSLPECFSNWPICVVALITDDRHYPFEDTSHGL